VSLDGMTTPELNFVAVVIGFVTIVSVTTAC